MKCPHCKTKLIPFTLDLMQCRQCWTVHEKRAKRIARKATAEPDTTLAHLACPTKGCD